MRRIKELYRDYLLARSRVSFWSWLDGQYETLDDLLKEADLKDLTELRLTVKRAIKELTSNKSIQ